MIHRAKDVLWGEALENKHLYIALSPEISKFRPAEEVWF